MDAQHGNGRYPGVPEEYEVTGTIPTNTGRSVHVARTRTGADVLVKVTHTDEWTADLRRQTEHYQVLSALAGARAYPEIIVSRDNLMVMPFYQYGSLDDLSLGGDHELVLRLTSEGLHQLFRIAALMPPSFEPSSEWTAAGASFVVDQARARVRRLDDAIAGPARQWASGREDVLEESTRWVTGGALDAAAGWLRPPRLTLAAHGDFGLNNIMLAEPAAPGARTVFIDTRGSWFGGYPWWDATMDLATLLSFHCRIEPTLADVGERDPAYRAAAGRLREDEILAVISEDDAFAAIAADDPGWRDRLEVEIAIRLLGNVSVQLLTAPENGEKRADAVLDLYLDQAARVDRILTARAATSAEEDHDRAQ